MAETTYVVLLYDDIYDSAYDNLEAARARVEQIEGIYGHAWFIESTVRSEAKPESTTDYLDYHRDMEPEIFREMVGEPHLRGLTSG